jgi:hypothetical protein
MKIVTSYKLRVTFFLLSAFCFLPAALNAQIEKKELELTPEMEEMVITQIKNLPEEEYFLYGITDRSQLMNLHIGKPIPTYYLFNDTLQFRNLWLVPVMSVGDPLFLAHIMPKNDGQYKLRGFNYMAGGAAPIAESIHNYKHKDLIIGSVSVPSRREVDYLIIRKENQDIFVQMYDEITDEYLKGEYFKNEFSLSELNNHLNEERMEAQKRRYAQVANKSELILTLELTEMLDSVLFSHVKNWPDWMLSYYGIKERSQLEHLHLGKPIPDYTIANENLTFIGRWRVPVMSDGEPLFLIEVQLEDNGQYRWVGSGSAAFAKIIHNYEHKDLIIGLIQSMNNSFLIIRKDNKDIFVEVRDPATREVLKNEYSLSEVLNLLKK